MVVNTCIRELRSKTGKNLKADILCHLDTSGETEQEKLSAIEEIRKILQARMEEEKDNMDLEQV